MISIFFRTFNEREKTLREWLVKHKRYYEFLYVLIYIRSCFYIIRDNWIFFLESRFFRTDFVCLFLIRKCDYKKRLLWKCKNIWHLIKEIQPILVNSHRPREQLNIFRNKFLYCLSLRKIICNALSSSVSRVIISEEADIQ